MQNAADQVDSAASQPDVSKVPFLEALWVWVKVAAYSFGGPAGQIAVMHKLLVEEKRWISEARFLHALNYCMLLPGPEAQQLATYTGWLLHKTRGGLVAGSLFILPGFVTILVLSVLYAGFQEIALVQALFFGLKPAVMAVVIGAVFQIGRRILRNEVMIGLAALSFIAIFFFNVPFPAIIITAGLIGFVGGQLWLEKFDVVTPRRVEGHALPVVAEPISPTQPSILRTLTILIVGLLIWFMPLLLIRAVVGPDSAFLDIGLFFSKVAVVGFGGAYAVLAYVAQEAVQVHGWLLPGEMLDGLGMAETTPGPLIQVVQFVGFMGAYRNPAPFQPMAGAVWGAIITTWVTFVPCFMWIFIGAPYIEYLRGNKRLTTALSAVTAAVVGVVLNLAVWFSLQVLFGVVDELYIGPLRLQIPQWSTLDLASLLIAVAAFVALIRFKLSMLVTLAGSASAGILIYLLSKT